MVRLAAVGMGVACAVLLNLFISFVLYAFDASNQWGEAATLGFAFVLFGAPAVGAGWFAVLLWTRRPPAADWDWRRMLSRLRAVVAGLAIADGAWRLVEQRWLAGTTLVVLGLLLLLRTSQRRTRPSGPTPEECASVQIVPLSRSLAISPVQLV